MNLPCWLLKCEYEDFSQLVKVQPKNISVLTRSTFSINLIELLPAPVVRKTFQGNSLKAKILLNNGHYLMEFINRKSNKFKVYWKSTWKCRRKKKSTWKWIVNIHLNKNYKLAGVTESQSQMQAVPSWKISKRKMLMNLEKSHTKFETKWKIVTGNSCIPKIHFILHFFWFFYTRKLCDPYWSLRDMSNVVFLVSLLFIIALPQLCLCGTSTSSYTMVEQQALQKLKESFSNSSMFVSWEGNDHSEWEGVECYGIAGHVIKLVLHWQKTCNCRHRFICTCSSQSANGVHTSILEFVAT